MRSRRRAAAHHPPLSRSHTAGRPLAYRPPRNRELRAATAMTALGVLLAIGFVVALAVVRPQVRYVTADGRTVDARDVAAGVVHAGNSDADLAAALQAARRLAYLRYDYDPATLNANLQAVYAAATPTGRQAIERSLPRAALAALVLGDSGTVQLRETPPGGYAYGLRPGRVRVVLPLTGRWHSRHVPFDGLLSGVPLATVAEFTMVRVPAVSGPGASTGAATGPGGAPVAGASATSASATSAWQLDGLTGEILAPSFVRHWASYGESGRPLPRPMIQGHAIAADTLLRTSYRRGVRYSDQS